MRCHMNEIATDFLTRCFAPGDTIALLLRNESTAKTQQRIVPLERALAPRYRGWLAHENHYGANIYVAANPRLAALRASELVPEPNVIVSTSAAKYQVLWRVEDFDFYTQEMTLKLLAMAFHGDISCTDCNRV